MKHPAYHLRTNKAVDRLEWIAQIRRAIVDESQAIYYSLSGPFLEDLRLAHSNFPKMNLVSIEGNQQTFNRQKFHAFCSTEKLRMLNSKIENFITHEYEPGPQDFFWLDFTDLKPESFNAFRKILTKIPHNSLIRLTVRAEPVRLLDDAKDHLTNEQQAEIKNRINADFDREFGTILSHDALKTPICKRSEFARTIQLMVRRISSEALDNNSERDFKHISSTRYDDGSQMLSVTGIVLDRERIDDSKKQLEKNGIKITDWPEPDEIEIPTLSLTERQHLNKMLPSSEDEQLGTKLLEQLNYHIDNGEKRSRQSLSQYAKHYINYPTFLKLDF